MKEHQGIEITRISAPFSRNLMTACNEKQYSTATKEILKTLLFYEETYMKVFEQFHSIAHKCSLAKIKPNEEIGIAISEKSLACFLRRCC